MQVPYYLLCNLLSVNMTCWSNLQPHYSSRPVNIQDVNIVIFFLFLGKTCSMFPINFFAFFHQAQHESTQGKMFQETAPEVNFNKKFVLHCLQTYVSNSKVLALTILNIFFFTDSQTQRPMVETLDLCSGDLKM